MAYEETRDMVNNLGRRASDTASSVARNMRKSGNGSRLAKGLGILSIGLGAAELIMPGKMAGLIGSGPSSKLIRGMGAREVATGVAILARSSAPEFLWTRVAGDAVDLSLLALAMKAPRSRKGRLIAALAAVGGVTALDVICSRRLTNAVTA